MIPKQTSCVLVGPSLEIPYELYVQSLSYFIVLLQLPQSKPAPRYLGIHGCHTDSRDQAPQGNMNSSECCGKSIATSFLTQ